jgi:hypothetical protein
MDNQLQIYLAMRQCVVRQHQQGASIEGGLLNPVFEVESWVA